MQQNSSLSKFSLAFWWPFTRTRPQFWSALWVLYCGVMALFMSLVQVLIKLAFGDRVDINFELIAHLVGSAGAGASASGLLLGSGNGVTRAWLRVTLFGAISGLVFAIIVELQHGPPVDALDCALGALFAAVIFPLVRWAALKGSQASS